MLEEGKLRLEMGHKGEKQQTKQGPCHRSVMIVDLELSCYDGLNSEPLRDKRENIKGLYLPLCSCNLIGVISMT